MCVWSRYCCGDKDRKKCFKLWGHNFGYYYFFYYVKTTSSLRFRCRVMVECKVCTAQKPNMCECVSERAFQGICVSVFVCIYLFNCFCLLCSVLIFRVCKMVLFTGHISQHLEFNFFSRLLHPALIASFLSQILQA